MARPLAPRGARTSPPACAPRCPLLAQPSAPRRCRALPSPSASRPGPCARPAPRCAAAAAAAAAALPSEASSSSSSNGGGDQWPRPSPPASASAPAPASSSSGRGQPAAGAGPASTHAASVAALYPAVALLPHPPNTGSLRDVVPYLIRLALDERHLRWRLAAAAALMVVTKLAGVASPLLWREVVDALPAHGPGGVPSGRATAGAMQAALLALGAHTVLGRIKQLADKVQTLLFTPVSLAVTRRVAYHTFAHVLSLDTRFHLDRRTGRVSRILERGTRAVGMLYRELAFTFLPVCVELAAVGLLLAWRFGPLLAGILGATFAAYVGWTVVMTRRVLVEKKEVNQLDNLASSKAVDALLNFETVTLFNNQSLEVGQYDHNLRGKQAAALRKELLSAGLGAGQGCVLAAGMAAILAAVVASGTATGGDLVLASGLVAQLWAPLQYLGSFYKHVRFALTDMEDIFAVLRTRPDIRGGSQPVPLVQQHDHQQQSQQQDQQQPHPHQQQPHQQQQQPDQQQQPHPHQQQPHQQQQQPHQQHQPHHQQQQPHQQHQQHQHQQRTEAQRRQEPCETAEAAAGPLSSGSSSRGRGPAASTPGAGLAVELVDVRFGYLGERQILRGVSLRVAPGESVAVVGSSGSGKSTILKLVTRLYDVWDAPPPPQPTTSTGGAPTANGNGKGCVRAADVAADAQTSDRHAIGVSAGGGGGGGGGGARRPSGVYINGVDVRQLRLEDLRAAMAVVPQDTALHHASILENIRYGRPGASDEEVVEAAKMARLDETVRGMRFKYGTVVGERGLKLSGGEKQRVAIARAFLRAPRLLICDEATSALDSATEAAIMDSLKELAAGRSALFVAHRLSTVRNCDRIVVLRGGGVVEEGSHEQLMERRGYYAKTWELQANVK